MNDSPDAHQLLVELNEAYKVLGDTSLKYEYDQRLYVMEMLVAYGDELVQQPSQAPTKDKRKQRGRKETPEEKQRRHHHRLHRNRVFNKKMRVWSLISLVFALSIFVDHYLPSQESFKRVLYNFKPEKVTMSTSLVFSIFTPEGKHIGLEPLYFNEATVALLPEEGLFQTSRIWKVLRSVQIGMVVFAPENDLHNFMLLYGLVSLSSLMVLVYKLEQSIFFPAISAFFSNILVLTFIVMRITS